MSEEKGKATEPTREPETPGREATDDPMTSFDPQAPPGEARGTAPAERPAVGNGGQRTVDEAAGPAVAAEGSEDAASDRQPGGQEPGATPGEGPEAAEADLTAQLEQARQESAAHYDRFLRLQAEFENYKKRIQKEHQESLRFALSPLVTEIAAVLDNLERAVEHARGEPEDGGTGLLEGIEMVLRQLRETLERFGITRIEAVGKAFDPALHEAMTVVETDEVPDNHVLQEFQAGYLLHERVIRPARVSVAKRGAEPSAAGN